MPYLSHLIQVAGLVLEFGGDESDAIAGLLHDAAEDAGGEGMLDQIQSEFGSFVAGVVRENSDSITESKGHKASWRVRKEDYIAAVPHKSRSACIVSLADKVHNARSLLADQRTFGDAHWERFNAGKAQALWYYRSLIEAFRGRLGEFPELAMALNELECAVSELEAD